MRSILFHAFQHGSTCSSGNYSFIYYRPILWVDEFFTGLWKIYAKTLSTKWRDESLVNRWIGLFDRIYNLVLEYSFVLMYLCQVYEN